jgi:hypothetical protein
MDYRPSAGITIDPSELSAALARLGLSQYEECLRKNGFEEWETVVAITENDMAELGFRLGDRRRLQHAIRERSSSSAVPVKDGTENPSVTSEGLLDNGEASEAMPRSSQHAARTTRSYRRHPRPDPYAPPKPKTAYVLFGEHVRQDAASSRSSFTEIAKETGKRWRELPSEERASTWERPAADRLQEYKDKLEHYKQTEDYQSYRTYFEEFEQRRHNSESTTPSDNKSSSAPKSLPFTRLLTSKGQEELEAILQESVDKEHLQLDLVSQETASPVRYGMDEVRHILKALGISSHLIKVAALPPKDMTTKAVKAFLHGTGSLLYFWNQTEVSNLVRSVYHPQSDSKPTDTTEVFAMSAVGSHCDGDVHTVLLREKFLHLFLHMLVSHVDMSDLHRMRLFTCLAICRFTNSVESARRLMRKWLMLLEFQAQHSNSPKCQPSTLEGTHSRLRRFEPKPPKRKYVIGGTYFEASFS